MILMSNTKGFDFKGTDEDWNLFTADLKKRGKAIETEFNDFVQRKLTLIRHEQNSDEKTVSRHQNDLTKLILQQDLSGIARSRKFHVELNEPSHIQFIQSARHELNDRIKEAVIDAVYSYNITKWAKLRDIPENQADVYYCQNDSAKILLKHLNNIDVSYSCNVIPLTTLSDLTEDDLGKVIQFDATIIGSSPTKLESNNNKYIQYSNC